MGKYMDREAAEGPARAKRTAAAAAKTVRLKKAAAASDKVRAAKTKPAAKPKQAAIRKPSKGSLSGKSKATLKAKLGIK